MINKESKNSLRCKRKTRIRKKMFGLETKPRLAVFKSNKYLYAQLIDDLGGKTLLCATTGEKDFKAEGTKTDQAKELGKIIAKRANDAGIKEVVFDRAGYRYHGIIKSFADSAREVGLKF
ncbi:MAG: 50S ribosomal protein L18 [Armatimonadota bacterium]